VVFQTEHLRDTQNAIIGYLVIGTDNTARKHAEMTAASEGTDQGATFTVTLPRDASPGSDAALRLEGLCHNGAAVRPELPGPPPPVIEASHP
jgi:hypothetical protein